MRGHFFPPYSGLGHGSSRRRVSFVDCQNLSVGCAIRPHQGLKVDYPYFVHEIHNTGDKCSSRWASVWRIQSQLSLWSQHPQTTLPHWTHIHMICWLDIWSWPPVWISYMWERAKSSQVYLSLSTLSASPGFVYMSLPVQRRCARGCDLPLPPVSPGATTSALSGLPGKSGKN